MRDILATLFLEFLQRFGHEREFAVAIAQAAFEGYATLELEEMSVFSIALRKNDGFN